MKRPRQPLFVARRTYRRRRMRDAARMLPVLAAGLFLVPMLWLPADGGARVTATDGIYLFVVWAGLILAARLLAPGLGPDPADTDEPEG
jgi:uncharacterized membrane protein